MPPVDPHPVDPVALTADLIRCASVTPAEGGALQLLEAGALRHHRVLDIARRTSWVIMQHFTAVIEDTESGRRYAVDTWFRDHGEPPVVMDMEHWKNGGYPDDWNARR